MGNRLSKITTRTGDDGTTGLADGTRVAKDALRINVIGTIDELNSVLGLLLSEELPNDVREVLTRVQHDLFDLGGALSLPNKDIFSEAHVERLDAAITHYNADLPPLKEFILPGGTRAVSLAHVARTICRRAEREYVALSKSEQTQNAGLHYLNRLSDLLFILARVINRAVGQEGVYWKSV